MPGKAKVGKIRTHTGAKKRARKTSTGKIRVQKAAHSHRLYPKNARQKSQGGHLMEASAGDTKILKKMLQ